MTRPCRDLKPDGGGSYEGRSYSNITRLDKMTQTEISSETVRPMATASRSSASEPASAPISLPTQLQIARSAVRNWEAGWTRPDPEYLYQMFTILNVEPNEFFGITGIGSLLTLDERQLIDNYRALDDAGKEDLTTIAEALVDKSHVRVLKRVYDKETPMLDMSRAIAAGDGADWEDYPEKEYVLLHDSPQVARADEIFHVNGDSMEPQFYDGDHVLVEYCTPDGLRPGDIGVFQVPGHGAVIKQVACDRLHSLNPKFDDIIPDEDGAMAIGRVLCVVTKDMVPTAEERALYAEAEELFGKKE